MSKNNKKSDFINKEQKHVLFSMPNILDLSKKIAKILDLSLNNANKIVFADGEFLMSVSAHVRNKNVYIIASTSKPVNDNLMELFLFIDALKRASAKTINLVLTYYGYARQDRKVNARQSIGAKVIADFIAKSGVTKLITIDLHNPSIQGFFDIPVDDLKTQFIIAKELKKTSEKFTIVSPDHGGAVRASALSKLIGESIQIAIIDKRRIGPNKSEIKRILGNVEGKNVVIIDDIIDTGQTIIHAAKGLRDAGAKKVYIAATHGLFNNGFEMFENSKYIDQVFVTDSVPNVKNIKNMSKLKIVSLAKFISTIIEANITKNSVANVYKKLKEKMF